jgi:hypothetical protein
MAEQPPPQVVEELYGAPLDEFVAQRDARAKDLRKGDRAAAEAVKRLRKPSVSAWAVNQLCRRAGDDVEALLAAGEALRQAQLGGGDREAIRAAARDEREAVDRLAGEAADALRSAGRKPSDAVLEEVRATLHSAALDDESRELIRRGVLTEARAAAGLGGFGLAAAPAAARRGREAPAARRGRGGDAKAAAGPAKADPRAVERKRAAEAARRERVAKARAALREAERAVKEADRVVATAERGLERARSDADAARAEADRRRERLEAAERD